MVQILGLFDEISFSIINGLYTIVAKVYNLMLELVRTGNIPTSPFDDFSTTLYVLAGVFMLFRTAISMLQMLINPDLISDKQAGAGKILTRIVMSIVMLMLFVPNGILFGQEGLFNRIEKALLNEEDGLVTRLSQLESMDKRDTSDVSKAKAGTAAFLIDNIYADSTYTCYYFKVGTKITGTEGTSNVSISKYYKITFSKKEENDGKKYTKVSNSDDWYFYSAGSNVRVGGGKYLDRSDKALRYTKLNTIKVLPKKESERKKKSTSYGPEKKIYAKDSSFSTCPAALLKQVAYYYPYNTTKFEGKGFPDEVIDNGLYGGATTPEGMINAAQSFMKAHNATFGVHYSTNSADITTPEEEERNGSHEYLQDVSSEAIVFAQGTASSLQECTKEKKEECSEAQQQMFKTSEGNQSIIDLMDTKDLDIGFLMSMITGIGLIVYLLLLCVEILVRKLKLYFLEIMAPLPVISYIDPKDKVFNQWMKMYISTYLDLFIKLISIGVAVTLLGVVFDDFWSKDSWLTQFFYIIAILTFAKIFPSMISKIFGLDSMGGSFKDILGMGKKALGIGAGLGLAAGAGVLTTGAAIGTGIMSGMKKDGNKFKNALAGGLGGLVGGLGNAATSIVKGAGGGMSGNIKAGAQQNLAAGARQRQGIAEGSTLKGRMAARLLKAGNFKDTYEKASGRRDVNEAYKNAAKAYEDESLNKVNKAIGNGHGDKFASLVEARNDYQAIRNNEQVSKYRRVDNADGTTDFINKLTGESEASFTTANMTGAEENYFNGITLNSAEAESRITGEEKAASSAMRAVFESSDDATVLAQEYGLNQDDYGEMKSLYDNANASARSAGYKEGYNSQTKALAKEAVNKYSAEALASKADHDAVQRGQ